MYHPNIYLENSRFCHYIILYKIESVLYKLVNGLLPDIMSDLCIVNNEVHKHFTGQSHFLHIRKGRNHISIQCFKNTGPRIRNFLQKKVTIFVPIAKLNLKQHQNCFSRNIYLNFTTPANSLH